MIFLALRQLLARPQQTILTFIAIVIGTAGYIAFSGIMFGFREYIIEQLVNNDAQIRISPRDELISEDMFNNIFFSDSTIKWIKPPSGKTDNSRLDNIQWWYEKLQKDPEIVAYSPQLVRQITFLRGKLLFPAKVIGVRPETQALITNTDKYIVAGGTLKNLGEGDSLAIIGANLQTKMGVMLYHFLKRIA